MFSLLMFAIWGLIAFGLLCLFVCCLFAFVSVMLLFVGVLSVFWYYLVGGKCLLF